MYNVFWNGVSGETLPTGIVEPTIVQRLADWTAAGKPDTSVVIGNAEMLTMYRVAIVRGLIAFNEIQFWFGGDLLELQPNMSFTNWPVAVSKGQSDRTIELLKYAIELETSVD